MNLGLETPLADCPGTLWCRAVRCDAIGQADNCGALPVSVKKHSSGGADLWKTHGSKRQIRGWRAVSAAGLQGKYCHERSFFFTGNGVMECYVVQCDQLA